MNNLGLSGISLACALSSASCVPGALVDIKPFEVHFGDAKTVFVENDNARRTLEGNARVLSRGDYLVDATTSDKHGRIWCKRGNGESYGYIFREKRVSLDTLMNLRSASFLELTNLLGQPVFTEGPTDHNWIGIGCWRTCNGKPGARFMAIEVLAGLKEGPATNAHNVAFLTVRIGHRK